MSAGCAGTWRKERRFRLKYIRKWPEQTELKWRLQEWANKRGLSTEIAMMVYQHREELWEILDEEWEGDDGEIP